MSLVVIAERCPYCSKPRNPSGFLRFKAFIICADCYQRHLEALAALGSGKYTGACSECGKSMDQIKAVQGEGDTGVSMVVHFENGIYRPMCLQCDRTYVPKRADLYGNTEFWRRKGL